MTPSEVANLIRSSTQVLFDNIKNPKDEFWIWLLLIRKFLRFISMTSLTESQLISQEETLEEMINLRIRLTRINPKNENAPKHNPPIRQSLFKIFILV